MSMMPDLMSTAVEVVSLVMFGAGFGYAVGSWREHPRTSALIVLSLIALSMAAWAWL